MFNDRSGFRAAAAVSWKPWDHNRGVPLTITATPSVFMDSQFYDYSDMTDGQRRAAMRFWLDEIRTVGGEAAVLWHPHTLAPDYGWADGFRALVEEMSI